MLESCWLKTRNFVRSLNVCLFVFLFCGWALKRAENFVLWLTIFIPHWNRLPCICGLRRHGKWNSWRPYNWESCSYNAHFLLAMSASTATSEIWVVYPAIAKSFWKLSCWQVNGPDFLGRFIGNKSNGISERVVLFFRTEWFKQNCMKSYHWYQFQVFAAVFR